MTRAKTSLLALIILVGTLWGTFGSGFLFPFLSLNHDESVYLQQADALLAGKIYEKVDENTHLKTSWFQHVKKDKLIFKYLPMHASFIAISKFITNDGRLFQAVCAGGLVFAMFLLVLALSRDEDLALISAGLLLLTPFYLIQTATYLSYATTLLIEMMFGYLVIKWYQDRKTPYLFFAGFLLGVAFLSRPFDAALIGLFTMVTLSILLRKDLKILRVSGFVLGVGFLPLFAIFLGLNNLLTSNPLETVFSIDSSDTIGFGRKRIMPNTPYLIFTPQVALKTFIESHLSLIRWSLGGFAALIPMTICIFKSECRSKAIKLSAAAGLTFSVGYFFFWGCLNFTDWGVLQILGPMYQFPLIVPVTIAIASGTMVIYRSNKMVCAVFVLTSLTLSIAKIQAAYEISSKYNDRNQAIQKAIDNPSNQPRLIIVPSYWGPFLGNPFHQLKNDYGKDKSTSYILSGSSLTVKEAVKNQEKGHELKRFYYHGFIGPQWGMNHPLGLEPLRVIRNQEVEFIVHISNQNDVSRFKLAAINGRSLGAITWQNIAQTDDRFQAKVKINFKEIRVESSELSISSILQGKLNSEEPIILRMIGQDRFGNQLTDPMEYRIMIYIDANNQTNVIWPPSFWVSARTPMNMWKQAKNSSIFELSPAKN